MKIRWLRKALRNVQQAYAYISKDDPQAATRTILKIQGAVSQLREFPFMGKSGRVEGTRELIIPGTPYFVVYLINEDTVEILRVLHSSRRYPDG